MLSRYDRLSIAAAVTAVALASAGAAMAAQAPEPAKPVDAARLFTGTWIEIGRRPASITNGCVAGATTYKAEGGDKVEVRDTCHQDTPSGREKAIGGPGTILDPGTNTKLHVSYRLFGLVPISRDYWILDHGDDYSWFISADPSFENLWIYTRDPDISPQMRKMLVERAQALGYDVTKLEFPAQP